MFSNSFFFSGQGPANNHTIISDSSSGKKEINTLSSDSITLITRLGQTLFFLFGLILLSSATFGQDVDSVSLSTLPHNLTLISQTSTAMEYELQLGTVSEPVNNAFGYYLSGEIADLDGTPATLEVVLANSWMGNSTEGDLTVNFDYTTGEFQITFIRDDSTTVSDYGQLIEISILAEPSQSIPDDARLTTGSGSLIMVDNSGFKRALTSQVTYQPLTAYPNPTRGQVHFQAPGFEGEWSLTNTAGRVIMTGNGSLPETIDLSGYPKGMYILVAQSGGQYYRSTLVRY